MAAIIIFAVFSAEAPSAGREITQDVIMKNTLNTEHPEKSAPCPSVNFDQTPPGKDPVIFAPGIISLKDYLLPGREMFTIGLSLI